MVNVGEPTYATDLNNPAWPKGLVAYGRRGAASGLTTVTSGTTVLGIIRIDSVVLKAGRQYTIKSGPMRPEMSVATDHFAYKILYNLAGTATTSSTELCRIEGDNTNRCSVPGLEQELGITSDTATASFLITAQRTSGTGTIQINASTTAEELWIKVFDEGLTPANTVVVIN